MYSINERHITGKDIFQELEQLNIKEIRVKEEEYVEVVFLNNDLDHWYKTLASHLGEPRKPAGQEPTQVDLDLTNDSGGIWVNQTLFEKTFEKVTVIAKFWPWGDEVHITLKMALLIH